MVADTPCCRAASLVIDRSIDRSIPSSPSGRTRPTTSRPRARARPRAGSGCTARPRRGAPSRYDVRKTSSKRHQNASKTPAKRQQTVSKTGGAPSRYEVEVGRPAGRMIELAAPRRVSRPGLRRRAAARTAHPPPFSRSHTIRPLARRALCRRPPAPRPPPAAARGGGRAARRAGRGRGL